MGIVNNNFWEFYYIRFPLYDVVKGEWDVLDNLKQLRSARGISQKALADAIGVSQQSINKYENHNIEPDIQTLCKIADYFGISVDYLVGRIAENNSNDLLPSLNVNERAMIRAFRRLTQKQQDAVCTVIDSFQE